MLLRNFTQNIDTLERLAGLDEERIVEAHGSFATASCVECRKKADMEMLKHKVASAEVACCEDCGGYIKPDITFFGESLPSRFFKQLNVRMLCLPNADYAIQLKQDTVYVYVGL